MPVDVDAHPIAWRETGDGQLVVLLHGLGGSRIAWDAQMDACPPGYRMVAWDAPGYGASAVPAEPLTFSSLAATAAELIGQLGGTAHVVGWSFGGMIAQYLAAWYPERVRTLSLLSSSPCFGLDGTSPADWRQARLAPLDAGQQPADFAESVLDAIAGRGISASARANQVAAMQRVDAAALRKAVECVITHDGRPVLSSIIAPTLVMVGGDDIETPVSYAFALADAIPSAKLVVVPDAGHLLAAEAPDDVNQQLIDHWNALEADTDD